MWRPVLANREVGGPTRATARPGGRDRIARTTLSLSWRRAGVEGRYATGPERFANLIAELHRLAGQRVVILVDEYDKPILDALATPDVARANRDYLGDVYSVVKAADADIKFTFFTGVSKFSKVSLFSGLNNLVDITMDPAYGEVCGYTDRDLDAVFAAELEGLDRERVRDWYNGYHWLGERKVYNPFDILLLFRNRRFGAYWFETGTPSFLIETLRSPSCADAVSRRNDGHHGNFSRRSTSTTSPPRRSCSRLATSPSLKRNTSATNRCTAWATRTVRSARA